MYLKTNVGLLKLNCLFKSISFSLYVLSRFYVSHLQVVCVYNFPRQWQSRDTTHDLPWIVDIPLVSVGLSRRLLRIALLLLGETGIKLQTRINTQNYRLVQIERFQHHKGRAMYFYWWEDCTRRVVNAEEFSGVQLMQKTPVLNEMQ